MSFLSAKTILIYPHLFEIKFDVVSEHFPDDSDKFTGTVPKGIVVGLAFGPLGHTGIISLEVSRLINRRI